MTSDATCLVRSSDGSSAVGIAFGVDAAALGVPACSQIRGNPGGSLHHLLVGGRRPPTPPHGNRVGSLEISCTADEGGHLRGQGARRMGALR
jgi:hypothetical protein